jgi:hypothetical protein
MLITQPQQILPRHASIIAPSPLFVLTVQRLWIHISPIRMSIRDRITRLVVAPVHKHDSGGHDEGQTREAQIDGVALDEAWGFCCGVDVAVEEGRG